MNTQQRINLAAQVKAAGCAHAVTPLSSAWRVARPGTVVSSPCFMPSSTAMLCDAPNRQRLRPAKISRTRLWCTLFWRDHSEMEMPWWSIQARASSVVRSFFIYSIV